MTEYCRQCDADEHRCKGCGEPLEHDQKTEAISGKAHPDCVGDSGSREISTGSENSEPETDSSLRL